MHATRKVHLPNQGHLAHFVHRDLLRSQQPRCRASLAAGVPATTLPVDCTNNRQVSCPTYGNNKYSDCGAAMAAHTIGILTYGQGKRQEKLYSDAALLQQYFQISGGDNGMNEDMEVGPQGIFTTGVGGDPKAIAVAHVDVDPNDVNLVQYMLDQFFALQLGWAVPDLFIQQFKTGAQFLQPMRPNPRNGHYTTISDLDADGNYTLWSWGTWVLVSQSMVASVQPSYFAVFCPYQFGPDGYDSHGRHVTTQAAAWQGVTGQTIPASVLAAFPPAHTPPAPAPTPTPTPAPGPGPVPIPPGPLPPAPSPLVPDEIRLYRQGILQADFSLTAR